MATESPAIVVKEIDLSGYVPNVGSTWGAFVGDFNWGPVEETTVVSDESQLVSIFGNPTKDLVNTTRLVSEDFHTAAYFLKYSNTLYVTRVVTDTAKNAYRGGVVAPTVKNRDDFDSQFSDLEIAGNFAIAKYPGALGNSLKVSICPVGPTFSSWDYEGSFIGAPGTSDWAASVGATEDEAHVAIIDEDGLISGTAGTVLETFPFVSLALNAKAAGGGSNYIVDRINNESRYIWLTGKFNSAWDSAGVFDSDAGDFGQDTTDFGDSTAILTFSLANGADSNVLTQTEYQTGYNLYEDGENIQIDFLIAPGMQLQADQHAMLDDLVSIATARKDCVVIGSPARADVINASTPNANVIGTFGNVAYNSYGFFENNYLKVYDRYNDQYIWIPASSSTAGLMAASDDNTAPWYSPAGQRRGVYLGVVKLAYTPTKAERDLLYRNSINPIANIPGQGVLLYGDKTHMARPSAFDRINVRRLFIVIERAISIAARNVLFEFNDEYTRAEFVNVVEPYLRDIQGRRGITDFRVIADETNNTPTVIDRNEFVCSIFIKPARSINFVTLNFVAVRTGVDFEEVVGAV